MSKRIYLASPYTSNSETLCQIRYDAACKACAKLIADGNIVFSPIAHSHPLVRYGLRGDFDYWREWCLSFIKTWATDFYILMLPGWNDSRGIVAEQAEALKMGLPITFLETEQTHNEGIMDKDFWGKVNRLEKLTEKATAGEWVANANLVYLDFEKSMPIARIAIPSVCHNAEKIAEIDADYIAAANPSMIRGIIAELRMLEKEADWLAGFIVSLKMCPTIKAYKCRHLGDKEFPASECVKCFREAARKTKMDKRNV